MKNDMNITPQEVFRDYWDGDIPFNEQITVEYGAVISAIEDYASRVKDSKYKELVGLLESALCPNMVNGCRLGVIPQQISEGEWEPEQCQWCYEREELLNKNI